MSNDAQRPDAAAAPAADENQLMAERRAKLAALRSQGVAYPNDFVPEHRAADLQARYKDASREQLETGTPVTVSVSGRMMLKRIMGKASFATIKDSTGTIQYFVNIAGVGEAAYEAFKHFDLGDIVAARGTLMRTKTGELSINCTEIRLLAKSLRPLPDKFHGLSDTEARYRQRYVDLIVNDETRSTFVARSKIMNAIRSFMTANGFLEVETPMMQPIPGGAAAKPFITHHNALDQAMY
ncbi:MAG TPA: amino acid--tRNA ligase-related protein, partial [Burkholderiaceae bacterium]|nr:amino acid--tRNA ligase-related protein [Burkholderiaceae bacterium]